uniref:Candidate secreted effector n=1 Tax=Meloidogyne incognita TaxID=6306 RepID=A0A914KWG8_MELIC
MLNVGMMNEALNCELLQINARITARITTTINIQNTQHTLHTLQNVHIQHVNIVQHLNLFHHLNQRL